MNNKRLTKQIKELALHFGERVSCEWLSPDGQEWSDWKNAEVTLTFLINVEKGYVRNIQYPQTLVSIQAELITSFDTFQEWKDNVFPDICECNPNEIVYIDQNNKVLLAEEDFLLAKDNGLFPIYAYRMVRNTDK